MLEKIFFNTKNVDYLRRSLMRSNIIFYFMLKYICFYKKTQTSFGSALATINFQLCVFLVILHTQKYCVCVPPHGKHKKKVLFCHVNL